MASEVMDQGRASGDGLLRRRDIFIGVALIAAAAAFVLPRLAQVKANQATDDFFAPVSEADLKAVTASSCVTNKAQSTLAGGTVLTYGLLRDFKLQCGDGDAKLAAERATIASKQAAALSKP